MMNETLRKLADLSAFVSALLNFANMHNSEELDWTIIETIKKSHAMNKSQWSGVEPFEEILADMMQISPVFPRKLFIKGMSKMSETINMRVELEIMEQARINAIASTIIKNGGIHIEEE